MTQVLVVEDDSLIRSQLVELLEAEGLQVSSAENGEKALDTLSASQFDTAIVDLRLPGIEGLEVIRQGHEVSPHTRMVAVSGYANPDVAAEAIRSGACEFLSKPFDIDRLTRILQEPEVERETEPHVPYDLDSAERSERMINRLLGDREVIHVSPAQGELPFEDRVPASRVHTVCATSEDKGEHPALDLPTLTEEIASLAKKHPKSAVIIDGFQGLVSEHSWDAVRRWLAQLCHSVLPSGSWVGVILDQELSDEKIAAELERLASDAKTARTVESLSHPVRRQVLRFLHLRRWATFSTILEQGFTESSPKLSFHLQNLVQRGMLTKDGDGMYCLTDAGKQAHDILRLMQEPEVLEMGNRRTLLITPMGGEGGNQEMDL